MKRIIITWMAALIFGTVAAAKERTVVERDSMGNRKRVIELLDTVRNGVAVTDTLSVMTYEKSVPDSELERTQVVMDDAPWWWGDGMDHYKSMVVISVTAIVFVFGLPVLLLFIIFYYRYKNRKAKYRLMEQALEKGQSLPAEFLQQLQKGEEQSGLSKGIKNIFLGIGLFIFLWALTGEFGLACVGLLIMFTGFGQVVIYYATKR